MRLFHELRVRAQLVCIASLAPCFGIPENPEKIMFMWESRLSYIGGAGIRFLRGGEHTDAQLVGVRLLRVKKLQAPVDRGVLHTLN